MDRKQFYYKKKHHWSEEFAQQMKRYIQPMYIYVCSICEHINNKQSMSHVRLYKYLVQPKSNIYIFYTCWRSFFLLFMKISK